MKKKILFVSYGAGHVRTILPVVKQILNDPASPLEPVVLALTTARSEMELADIPSLGFCDLGLLDPLAKEWGHRLAGPIDVNSVVAHSESVAYMGRSYADMIEMHGERGAAELYAEKGRAAFFPISTARKALDYLDIDAVVATNSPRAEKAFLEAARQTGRPSVAIWSSLASHEIAWVGQPGFTSRVCVDGIYAEAQMQQAGRPPNEIVLTGNPQFDSLKIPRKPKEIADFRSAHGWGVKDKVLLFAQQNEPAVHPFTGVAGTPDLPQKLNDALIAALGSTKEAVRLCLRYHPNQTPLPFADDHRITQSPQSEDLGTLLHAVDAVFTCSSTVAYQAAIIGKPIIQGMFSMFSKEVPFEAIAGALTITNYSEFDSVLEALCKENLPQSTLSTIGIEPAAHNVVQVLEDLLL